MIRFVYKTTNNITGKIYIGQHSTENLDDGYMGSGVYLQKAFKKYGKENFTREIIALTDTQEDLNHAEEYYIKHYTDKVGKSRMYNATEHTGGCPLGIRRSEETKLKMSKARKGQPSPRKGRHLTEETKLKISKAQKGHPGWNKGLPGTFTGRKHTEETKLKMSKARKGRPAWNKGLPGTFTGRKHTEETKKKISEIQKNRPNLSKKVLCVETGEIYPSISEASRHTNIGISTISNICKGKQKTTGGYHWKYIEE